MGSDFLGCVKFGALRSDLSHAVSIECEAVSVVDEPVEDGVSDGRIGDDIVPIFDRHLAGDDIDQCFPAQPQIIEVPFVLWQHGKFDAPCRSQFAVVDLPGRQSQLFDALGADQSCS